jgi:PRTRC genetic system protein B
MISIAHPDSTPNQRQHVSVRGALVFADIESEGTRNTIATLHPVTVKSRVAQLGAGQLVDSEDLDCLLVALRQGRRVVKATWLSPDVLATGTQFAAWSVPSAIRPMWFRLGKSSVSKALSVRWPNLIVACRAGRVYVAATAKACRRGDDPQVFVAPLMNIFANSAVCMPPSTHIDGGLGDRKAAEDVIFTTAFSHVNHDFGLAARYARGDQDGITTNRMYAYWKSKAHSRTSVSPADLVPMKMTASQWIERISGEN